MNTVPPERKNQTDRIRVNPSPANDPNQDSQNQNSDSENEPRRYDEADPNWQEPDVQMHAHEMNQMVDIPEVNDFTVAP